MLCSHPSERFHARQTRRRAHRNESSFICGTVKTPWGSNVVIPEKSRVLKRISKKDGALQKHMTWLKELREERRRLDEKKEEEHKQRLERRRVFQEREAKKRSRSSSGGGNNDITTSQNDPGEEQQRDFFTGEVTSTNSQDAKRPAWAQSEESHKMSEEVAAANDEDDLLDFVDNLDFDQYSEDLELQTLMSQVKDRIKTLQKDKKKHETRLQTVLDVSIVFGIVSIPIRL